MLPTEDLFVYIYVLIDDLVTARIIAIPPRPGPVPPGYSIAWVDLPFIGRRAGAVVVGWLGAAEDRLSAHALVIRPDGAGVPRGSGEGC